MSLQDILADIHSLEEDLLAFERKYGIRSEIFHAAYISGEEPEDDRISHINLLCVLSAGLCEIAGVQA